MARPMSAASQEVLDIVRAHGPIARDQILERATQIADRAELAVRLNSLTHDGHLLRTADKRYVLNGRAPASTETPARAAATRTPHWPTPAQASADDPETAPATGRTVADLARKHVAPQRTCAAERPHDAVAPSTTESTEDVLQQTADNVRAALDATLAMAGDLAPTLRSLIDLREKTLEILINYRRNRAA